MRVIMKNILSIEDKDRKPINLFDENDNQNNYPVRFPKGMDYIFFRI